MNYIYPAVFYPEEDGRYSVIFPDLNDLATYGDNLADAFAMAQEACGQYLFTSLRDGEKVPASTPISEVKMEEEAALVNLICVNLDEYAKNISDAALSISYFFHSPPIILTRKSDILSSSTGKQRQERIDGYEVEKISGNGMYCNNDHSVTSFDGDLTDVTANGYHLYVKGEQTL